MLFEAAAIDLDHLSKLGDRLVLPAGLEPLDMVSLGRHRPEHLPPAWQPGFERLGAAERYRVMELLNPAPTSPTVVARKK